MSSPALEADALYSGYMNRQAADIDAMRKDEKLDLPGDLDYAALPEPVGRSAAEVAAHEARDDRPGGADRRA